MKKRIIAALTAMVMVVTMIPSSAFAATVHYDRATVEGLIKDAAFGSATALTDVNFNVAYTDECREKIDLAKSAYANLSEADKQGIENDFAAGDADKLVSYQDLLVAEELYNYSKDLVKAYDDAMATLKPESLVANSNNFDDSKVATDIAEAYKMLGNATPVGVAIVGGKAVRTEANAKNAYAKSVKPATIQDDPKIKNRKDTKLMKKMFGADMATDNIDFAGIVSKMNSITEKQINGITSNTATYTFQTEIETTIGRHSDLKEFLMYAKGYKNYVLATEKVNAIKGVATELTNANATITAVANNGVGNLTTKFKADDDGDLKDANLYIINGGNIDKVKAIYNDVKSVYNKYAKDENVVTTSEWRTFKGNYVLFEANVATYEEAVRVKNFINQKLAASELSLTDVSNIEKLNASKVYGKNEAVKDIDLILLGNVDTARLAATQSDLDKLVIKATAAKNNLSKADFLKYYADKLNAAIAKVPEYQNANYADNYADVKAIFGIFDEMASLASSYKITKNLDAAIGTTDKSTYDRLAVVAKVNGAAAETIKNYDTDFVKVFTDEDFAKFVSIAKAMVTEKDAVETISTTIGQDITDAGAINQATVQKVKTLEKAIAAYEKAVSELGKSKALYDALQALKLPVDKDAVKVEKAKAEIADFNLLHDTVINGQVALVVKTINDNIAVKVNGKDLTAQQVARNKEAFAEIAKIFQTPNVELVFRGAKKVSGALILEREYEKDYTNKAAFDNYVNKDAIIRYLTALAESEVTEVPATVTDVINAIDGLTVSSDLDANLDAYVAVSVKYDALSSSDKVKVTNYGKLSKYALDIAKQAVKAIEPKMAELKIVTDSLSAGQLKVMDEVETVLNKYEKVLVDADAYSPKFDKSGIEKMFRTPFDTTGAAKLYYDALKIKNDEKLIIKNEIAPVYMEIAEAITANKYIEMSGLEAQKNLAAIAKYNALSDIAKEVLVANGTADAVQTELKLSAKPYVITAKEIELLLKAEANSKAVVLDYATVEKIADQEATGEAITPAVVVKDANGNVIDNSKLNITYTNNTLVGTATIVIVPADESLAGRLEANFNIVKGEASAPVVPTAAKLATDQGIIKVTVAKVDGLTYRFMVRKANTNKWITKNSKTNSAVFTGLVKNTMYEVKVATVLGNEVSEFNNLGFVHTNKLANKPARMYKAIINKVTIKKGVAKVTTKNVAYKNEQYRVGFKKYGTKNFKWNAWGTNTVKTVKGLKKGVKYTFTIQYRYKSAVSGTFVYSNYAKYVVKTAK